MCYAQHLYTYFTLVVFILAVFLAIVRIIPVLGKLVLHNNINTMSTLMSQRSQCISTLNTIILIYLISEQYICPSFSFIFITWLVCIFLTLFVFGAKRSRMYNHCWLEFYGLFCPRKDEWMLSLFVSVNKYFHIN